MKKSKKIDVNSPEYRNLVNNLLGKEVNFEHIPKIQIPKSSPVSTKLPPLKKLNVSASQITNKDSFSIMNKDMLVKIALELDLPDLMNLCLTNPEYNRKICNDNDLWRWKMIKDFPDVETRTKERYTLLYNKFKLAHEETGIPFAEIYKIVNTILTSKQIMKSPPELILLTYRVAALKEGQHLVVNGEIFNRISLNFFINRLDRGLPL